MIEEKRQNLVSVSVSVGACLVVGAVPLLQPLLLGEMARMHRLTTVQIGQAATLETLGMTLTTLLGALFLSRHSLRKIGAFSAFAIALACLATSQASGVGVLASRFCAGFFEGIIVWIFWATMAQQKSASRVTAVYVVLEASTAGGLGLLFSIFIAPRLGASGAYLVLAALNFLTGIAFLLGGPKGFRMPTGSGLPLPNKSGLLGILAVGCHLGGIMAFWVYAPLVATSGGVPLQTARIVLSLVVFGQMLGGFIAFMIADRVKPHWALCAVIVPTAAAMAVMSLDGVWSFAVSTLAISVFWLFSPSFHMGLLLSLDGSGRSAALLGTAQLAGVSAGPLLSSIAITAGVPFAAQSAGILLLCLGLVFGAMAVLARAGARERHRREILAGI